jgi:hypothetical protein
MTHALRFRDHQGFHRAALQMAAAGGAAGLVAHLLTGAVTAPLSMALIAGAAVVGAMAPQLWTARELALRGTLIALAAAGLALLPRWGAPAAGLALFGGLFAAALSLGLRGRAFLLAVSGGALIAVLGRHAMAQVAGAQELASLPHWLAAAVAGSVFSVVSVVALVPRHLQLVGDPVGDAYRGVAPSVDGEVKELVDRGYTLWGKAADGLHDDDPHRETLAEGIIRLFAVADRWQRSNPEAAADNAEALSARVGELDRRIEATGDEVARQQYGQARDALAEQLRYLQNIDTSRERVLARMHNYLAAMERLRMALIQRDTVNASRDIDVEPLISDVESLGRDIDLSAEAWQELEA